MMWHAAAQAKQGESSFIEREHHRRGLPTEISCLRLLWLEHFVAIGRSASSSSALLATTQAEYQITAKNVVGRESKPFQMRISSGRPW
jgi:hypothetical protein